MQRSVVQAARTALAAATRSDVEARLRLQSAAVTGRLNISSSSVAGPSRPHVRSISASAIVSKKGKVIAEKPSKGKIRAQDDPSVTDVDVDGVLEKVKGRMEKAVDWAKGVVYDGVERGRGRVSPALLDGIRVQSPEMPLQPLTSVASVTIKQNTLFVEVFDTAATKHVEAAIHKANLPGLSPQRVSDTTLKVPVSRPTSDQRGQILRTLNTNVESAKQQVRTARADGLKMMGGKGAQGADDVQKLADAFGGDLDKLLVQAKKELEK